MESACINIWETICEEIIIQQFKMKGSLKIGLWDVLPGSISGIDLKEAFRFYFRGVWET